MTAVGWLLELEVGVLCRKCGAHSAICEEFDIVCSVVAAGVVTDGGAVSA